MKVAVIGGGASGMMAALTAADRGASVTIYEHNKTLGHKILMTGNGRCNLTNVNMSSENYNLDNDTYVTYFGRFGCEDTIDFFNSIGLKTRDINGYIYPYSEQASAVRAVLVRALENHGIRIITEACVSSISRVNDSYIVTTASGDTCYDRIILACGSYASIGKNDRIDSNIDGYALSYHLGHNIVPVKPALCPILCRERELALAKGVRAKGSISIYNGNGQLIASDAGELQFIENGISGIPAFNLSRYINDRNQKATYCLVDVLADTRMDELNDMCDRYMLNSYGSITEAMLGIANDKLIKLVLALKGISDSTVNKDILVETLRELKNIRLNIKGTQSMEHAQVCTGGVDMRELDSNLESIVSPGLFICGEMADVDGRCGGYNLQWAWTSGYIAGIGATGNNA